MSGERPNFFTAPMDERGYIDLRPPTEDSEPEQREWWAMREYIAMDLAKADKKRWTDLPNVATLWFKDKMHYRDLADVAIASMRSWQTGQTSGERLVRSFLRTQAER